MAELEIIKHDDILFRDLLRAVALKNVAWPHPVESQVKWIIDNMQPDDMHSIFKESKRELPGMEEWYANFVHIPCGWWVSKEDREKIVEVIKKGW